MKLILSFLVLYLVGATSVTRAATNSPAAETNSGGSAQALNDPHEPVTKEAPEIVAQCPQGGCGSSNSTSCDRHAQTNPSVQGTGSAEIQKTGK